MPLGDPRVAPGLLELPAGTVVALGRLLGARRGRLQPEVGLDERRLDPGDVVGRLCRLVAGVWTCCWLG